ncbi:MAG: hypothetical protein ACR2F1_12065 [Nitrososphaeraceae archaeon]
MTAKLGELSDRQKAIVESIRMRLNEKQALIYLEDIGFEMSARTYYREKCKVESLKLKRLYHIAQIGFQDQHLARIDTIELCLKFLWENYNKEQDPFKKFQMAKDIILVQPYLSSYYEATRDIIVKQPEYQEFLMDDNQQQHEKQREEEFTRLDNYRSSFTYGDDKKDDNRKF